MPYYIGDLKRDPNLDNYPHLAKTIKVRERNQVPCKRKLLKGLSFGSEKSKHDPSEGSLAAVMVMSGGESFCQPKDMVDQKPNCSVC